MGLVGRKSEEELVGRKSNTKGSFKFEAKWLKEEGFKNIIKEGWESAGSAERLTTRVKGVAASLKDWNSKLRGIQCF